MTLQMVMSWIGLGIVAVLAGAGVLVLIRRMVTIASSPAVERETSPVSPVPAGFDWEAWDKRSQEQITLVVRNQERTIAALDSIAVSFDRFSKGQDNWLRKMLGGDGGGYTDMNQDQEELRERAEGIRRRYGIPWDEAMDRAKKTIVYEPEARMKDRA